MDDRCVHRACEGSDEECGDEGEAHVVVDRHRNPFS
jgi:hypothetical protein